VIETGDVIAAHEAEAELHAAMRTTIFPYMRDAAVVAPHHQFLIQQARTGGTAGLDRVRQTERMPAIIEAHFKSQSGRQIDVMARNIKHETVERTEAACHLECVDQFNGAGNIHGDGLGTGRSEFKFETKSPGAMFREFHEALRPECASEDETRVFVAHRVRSDLRSCVQS
jgi:hypothetical protein